MAAWRRQAQADALGVWRCIFHSLYKSVDSPVNIGGKTKNEKRKTGAILLAAGGAASAPE